LFAQNSDDSELAEYLINDSLENVISSFDSFGRVTIEAYSKKTLNQNNVKEFSFQNIEGSQKKLKGLFNIDLADGFDSNDWDFIIKSFQERHLLAHSMGIIDEEYIKKGHDPNAIIGEKYRLNPTK
jgi:hypothetical protein